MAHAFSVEIQNFLTGGIKIAEDKKSSARQANDLESEQYYAGQLQELHHLRQYLTENFDLKNHKYY
jgi:hypothetical protein